VKWFRFYYEVAEDPKVQTLVPRLFKLWINALCLAAKNGGVVPPVAQMAYMLRMGRARVDYDLAALQRAGLFDETETGLVPHNWNGRQFKSDAVAERVKKHRSNADCNVTNSLDETPLKRPSRARQKTEYRGGGEETQTRQETDDLPLPLLPRERR